MEFNNPALLAEVRMCFEAYEQALIANDLATLDAFFWHSEHVVRYGFNDAQHGFAEVQAFRASLAQQSSPRDLIDTSIMVFGPDVAVVDTQFIIRDTAANDANRERRGRQSQVWIRIDNDWKVASAHVSWPQRESGPATDS
jgi:Protein of unknown function (DUF3225)